MTHGIKTGNATWILVLSAMSIVFSLGLACATPFAGLAAIAALTLSRRDAFIAAGLVWLANQVVGFGLLGYPTDPTTLGWGVALGISALAAVAAAQLVDRTVAAHAFPVRATLVLAAALTAQQLVVYAAYWPLSSHPTTLSFSALWYIGWTNALAFIGLATLMWIGAKVLKAPAAYRPAG